MSHVILAYFFIRCIFWCCDCFLGNRHRSVFSATCKKIPTSANWMQKKSYKSQFERKKWHSAIASRNDKVHKTTSALNRTVFFWHSPNRFVKLAQAMCIRMRATIKATKIRKSNNNNRLNFRLDACLLSNRVLMRLCIFIMWNHMKYVAFSCIVFIFFPY